ncbi:hypothetical protein E2562_015744 [Oryza meyeriana var. granulata]|uniref:Uncharacterized protein n=1 Tax=Oryza meyeriana var. granulata TaxID=110450 RepID=A0A6G1D4E0_9ORYZ|nr:hypothetical protein E2562_015744 [Oryza meyeriana var. granulata]
MTEADKSEYGTCVLIGRRGRRVELGLVLDEVGHHLHERNTIVRVQLKQRMPVTRRRGEGEGIETSGAAPGQAREDDVGGAWLEAAMERHDPGDPFLAGAVS